MDVSRFRFLLKILSSLFPDLLLLGSWGFFISGFNGDPDLQRDNHDESQIIKSNVSGAKISISDADILSNVF